MFVFYSIIITEVGMHTEITKNSVINDDGNV